MGSQWGMLVVLAKLGSPEMVGHFALGQAVAGPIILFSMLQLRGYQATDTAGEYMFGHYFALRLLTSCIGFFLVLFLAFAFGYRAEIFQIIMVTGLFKAVEGCGDVCYGAMQQQERMDRVAIGKMVKGPLLFAVLSLGLYWTGNLIISLVGMVCVLVVVFFVYDLPTTYTVMRHTPSKAAGPKWEWNKLGQLAKISLPLGIVMVFTSVNSYLPRYFIEHFHGSTELGIFVALASLQKVGGQLIQAVHQSAAPRFARYYQDRDRYRFSVLLLKMAGVGTLLGSIGVLVAAMYGEKLITLLFGSKFVRWDVFLALCVAGWVRYTFSLGTVFTATRYIRIQMPVQLVVFLSLLVACWLLVPSYGILGAVYSLLVCLCIQTGCGIIILIHLYSKKFTS